MRHVKELVAAPWAYQSDEVAARLGSQPEKGLSEKAVKDSLRKYGPNQMDEYKRFSAGRLLLRQCASPLIWILLVAVLTTFLLGEVIDSLIIAMAVLINIGLGYYQESRAELAVDKLRSFITVRTRVVREGREQEIDAKEVVVGDVVHLSYGSRVPADGRIISEQGLMIDEAILTGESLPVEKNTDPVSLEAVLSGRTNMAFGGTLVTEGTALMIVTAVGHDTELGQIAVLVGQTRAERTPLQKTVSDIAWIVTIAVAVFVAAVFMLGVSRGESVYEMFIVSIAVAVGAIPEALPIGLTAVLAVGVERLAKRKGIMRNLAAAETLGSTTVVMTDKTGTLTTASLEMVGVHDRGELLNDPAAAALESGQYNEAKLKLIKLAAWATDVLVENPQDDPRSWRMSGSVLESTLFRKAAQIGVDVAGAGGFVPVIPFSSSYKFSVSRGRLAARNAGPDGQAADSLIIIGAPDILLDRSDLSKDDYIAIRDRIIAESESGKRLLGVAIMPAGSSNANLHPEAIKDIEFAGVVTFHDPVRPEVPAAIKRIEQFGVKVVIATGDLPGTAAAVARSLGWQVEARQIIKGESLASLSDEKLKEVLHTIRIFARVTPADKLRIARLFQKEGEIVAMTGDGVNDAPSLKAVDIGIAVGSGSDVAKGVADLILLDDNFNTIVAAIEEGRRVLANIRKTFVYLMSNSLDELFLIGGSLLLGLAMPLSAMQIIWVNFFTGSVPAVAFAFDTEAQSARRSARRIISRHVIRLTICIGLVISAFLFLLYYLLDLTDLPAEMVRTYIYVCFALYILIISYSFRNLHLPIWKYRVFSNQVLNFGVVIGCILTVATLYIPFLQSIFNTEALSVGWWAGVAGWLLFTVIFVELVKWISHRLQYRDARF